MGNKKIAVIGAGFAGLSAAYYLLKKGHQVEILEASSNVGGLVTGFELKNGAKLEKAYHFFYKNDNYLLDLVKELGTEDQLVFNKTEIGAYYDGKLLPFTTAKDLLTFPGLSLIDKFRTGVTALRLKYIKNWQKLTEVTAEEWMVKNGGQKAYDILWGPLLSGKFSKYSDKIAMSWLWRRIQIRQKSQDISGHETLGYFKRGWAEAVVEPLVAAIKDMGGEIKLNQKISQISSDQSGVKIIIDDDIKLYDKVIATIPSHIFAKLISGEGLDDYKTQLSSIEYLDAIVGVFTSEKRITPYFWNQFQIQNPPFLVMLNLTELVGDTSYYGGKQVYYIGSYLEKDDKFSKQSEDKIFGEWLKGVQKLAPDFELKDVDEYHVFKLANAQHIVGVGYKAKIPEHQTPLQNVYLVNFTQIFPDDRGTNYAIRDGKKIAEVI